MIIFLKMIIDQRVSGLYGNVINTGDTDFGTTIAINISVNKFTKERKLK